MSGITDQGKKRRNKFLTGFLALLLVMSFALMDGAFAQPLIAQVSGAEVSAPINENSEQSLPAEVQPEEQELQGAGSELQTLVTETQVSFQKALEDTDLLISDLSQQIERVASEPRPSIRKQIKRDIEDRQDLLENIADDVDDLAEKVEEFNSQLKSSVERSQLAIDPQLQNNSYGVEQSLENVAKTLNLLADNTEKAKKNSTPILRSQIEQQIGAVRQALEEADQAIKVLTEKPV